MKSKAKRPSLLDRLRGLARADRLLPLEQELVRRTILALDDDHDLGPTPDDILRVSERRSFSDGDVIITEGQREDCVYVLLDGQAVIERDGLAVGELRAGEVFGEVSMLTGAPRMATVRAVGETVVLRIPADTIDETLHERLWEYAGERRFMSLRGNPVADLQRRHLWWRLSRTTTLLRGEYDAGSPWLFLYAGELEVDGQRVHAPALMTGGRVHVVQDGARVAMLSDPADLPG